MNHNVPEPEVHCSREGYERFLAARTGCPDLKLIDEDKVIIGEVHFPWKQELGFAFVYKTEAGEVHAIRVPFGIGRK